MVRILSLPHLLSIVLEIPYPSVFFLGDCDVLLCLKKKKETTVLLVGKNLGNTWNMIRFEFPMSINTISS